jgi:hypothetical protein
VEVTFWAAACASSPHHRAAQLHDVHKEALCAVDLFLLDLTRLYRLQRLL